MWPELYFIVEHLRAAAFSAKAKVVQADLRQVGDPGDDTTEPRMWVDIIETAGLDQ